MNPTGDTVLGFSFTEEDLMMRGETCFKIWFSFKEFLVFTFMSGSAQSLLFLASQIQKEHSIDNLLKFFMVDLTSLLLKPSFFKQNNTDFEQYPLAPTSTAKRSTHQPLVSMTAFKGEYLESLELCQASMFSSQGHVSSIITTRFKAFEKIVMSGLS